MPIYHAPIRDFQFVINEFLDVQQYKGKLKGFDDIDEALSELEKEKCDE